MQTYIHTDRQADIQTKRQTRQIYIDRQTDIVIQTDRHSHTDRQTDIQSDRQTDIHTVRHTDRHTYIQTDRQTDRRVYRNANALEV